MQCILCKRPRISSWELVWHTTKDGIVNNYSYQTPELNSNDTYIFCASLGGERNSVTSFSINLKFNPEAEIYLYDNLNGKCTSSSAVIAMFKQNSPNPLEISGYCTYYGTSDAYLYRLK